jgi:hypothetical protein
MKNPPRHTPFHKVFVGFHYALYICIYILSTSVLFILIPSPLPIPLDNPRVTLKPYYYFIIIIIILILDFTYELVYHA